MIRNIIFDWSGTVVDDLSAVWKATNHVLRQAGLEELTLERFRAEFKLPFTGFYERYMAHVPMAQLEEWFHGHYRQVQSTVAVLPHAREFLESCRERGVRMFVLSTIHRDHFAVQSAGLADLFERAYVEIWDKRSKIRELLAEHHLDPSETLMIGDMQHDIETAKAGGIFSCAVLTGYTGLEQLRSSQPDLIVEHLGELRSRLQAHEWEFEPLCSHAGAESKRRPVITVGALIFDPQQRLLMIRTRKWSNRWGIPGGKIRFGETAADALKRELKEETNLDIDGIEFVLVQDCIGSKEFYRHEHFVLLNYTCRCDGKQEVILNDEAEAYRWVSMPEALQLDLNEPTRRLICAVMTSRGGLEAAIA